MPLFKLFSLFDRYLQTVVNPQMFAFWIAGNANIPAV
jgi:hypothetical protein